ncbi:hydroxyacylglutathione hydrolase family protein [Spirochaetota bacterium]
MFVKQFSMGGDRNFGYLAACDGTKKAAVIDPSYTPKKVYDFAQEKGFGIEYIFITHGHYDHTSGIEKLETLVSRKGLLYGSTDPVTGTGIMDNTKLPLGDLSIQIIHTPGHTGDSMCILVGDALFTGDTLFVGKVGGTGFGVDAKDEYDSFHDKLLKLPDNIRVFPGHDYGTAVESTIGNEKKTNPFLLCKDLPSFIDLKKNWLEYKSKHGIK